VHRFGPRPRAGAEHSSILGGASGVVVTSARKSGLLRQYSGGIIAGPLKANPTFAAITIPDSGRPANDELRSSVGGRRVRM
jgi:hypothetical protein